MLLSSSLDVETTLASVARLAVPRIADWCIVYMREDDGTIRRLAIEHAGGDAQAVGDVLDRYPLDVEAEVGVPLVVRTGQTLLLADVSAEGLMADVIDPEGLAAELKQIELASYLCVPLIARGRTLGAISLLSSESGRRFGPDEKELAEQLAGRAALAVDNGRLYREAEQAAARERRRSEQLLRLSQAALLVNSATDLDELLAVLTARAREIVGAARAVTTIGDAAEGEATVKAVAGLGTPPQDAAVLAAPLLARDGRTLGAIELVGSADHPFSAEDEAILVQLAQMASVAVENFRAEAERERLVVELRSQGALLEAVLRQLPSGVIIAAPDGGVVMSNDQAAEIFQERFEVASFAGADAPAAFHEGGRPYEPPEWPLARAVERGESVAGEAIEIRRADGSRRIIEVSAAPVRAGGEVVAGVTTFSDVTDRARAEQRLRFLAEASTVLGSSLDYEQTLVAVSELAVPMLADWCSISVLEDDDTIKVVSWTHSDPERRRWADEMRTRRQVRLDDATPTAEVIRSGKPVLIREITDEIVARYRSEDAELARAMGVRSFVVVPFTSGAGTLGSIMLVSAESGREFDDDDVLLARELGRRAGAAIENARLYQAMEQRARAAEALEFVGEGVLLVAGDGIVRIWNPQAEAITGLAVRDVEGLPAAEAIPGWEELSELVPVVDAADALRSRSQVVPFMVEGGELWLAMSGVRFPDGTVYAFRDITEERGARADEERLRLDHLARAADPARRHLRRRPDAPPSRHAAAGRPAPGAARRDLGRGRPPRAHRQRHPLDEPDRVRGDAGAHRELRRGRAGDERRPGREAPPPGRRRARPDRRRRPARGGGPGQGAAGAREPRRQRRQVLARRRPRRGRARAARRRRPLRRLRRGPRDPGSRARARLREVLPPRPGPHARRRRHRPRPLHLPRARAADGRVDLDRGPRAPAARPSSSSSRPSEQREGGRQAAFAESHRGEVLLRYGWYGPSSTYVVRRRPP